MSVINSIPLIAAGDDGYQISRSVRLRSSASAYFNRTPASAGDRTKFTVSAWVKFTPGSQVTLISAGTSVGNDSSDIYINTSGNLVWGFLTAASWRARIESAAVFRDPSAWYHIVVNVDTSQLVGSGLYCRMYVNGSQITTTTAVSPNGTGSTYINSTSAHYVGRGWTYANYLDGYLTEVNFIDGQALTPSSFGETDSITGVWKPKKYAGTYGTNGFYLNFSDNSGATATTIGKDSSGNGNNWTPNNISVTAGVTYDSMLDVPTLYADGGNGRGNYCTLNPANNTYSTGSGPKFFTLTNGNLTGTTSAGGGGSRVMGTVGVSSGKWYAEATIGAASINASAEQGLICVPVLYQASSIGGSGGSGGVVYVAGTGQKRTDASGSSAYGSTYTTGDVIGVALDMDLGTVTFYKNNVSQGVALSGLTGSYTIGAQANDVTSNANYATYEFNFGQRPFTYTPPTGFVALNTQNLPTPTISNGAQYMAASLFTGTSGNVTVSNAVNGISFQPDFLWFKARSNAQGHSNVDSVRGASKLLQTNLTNAESTLTNPPTFNADGFTSTTDIHTNGYTYVAWQWKKGATQGFDIVTWTGNSTSGRTVAHSLGVAPKLIITKGRTNATSWTVGIGGMTGFGVNDYLSLNTTDAKSSSSTFYQAYGSSTFTVGVSAANEMNKTGNDYVSYLFSEVAGFSKFGSYTGNGSADGVFVYCGFKPRWVMLKNSAAIESWYVFDSARDTYNAMGNGLFPNLSNAETGSYPLDFLSNGFKLRVAGNPNNANTYIFAAFSENPFKLSLAR